MLTGLRCVLLAAAPQHRHMNPVALAGPLPVQLSWGVAVTAGEDVGE